MNFESTGAFERSYVRLPEPLKTEARAAMRLFVENYAVRQFPKGLRVHKCGAFVSISVNMDYRVFLHPVPGGIRFVFIGNHRDADQYLKAAK